jgi:hypothetical protein
MIQKFFSLVTVLSIFFLLFQSCKKDEFETGQPNLEFSEDTIIFDTVFTTVGSSTEVFQVYNRGVNPIRFSSIRLATGDNSNYRLNVDGVPGKSFQDVEIAGKDSMFIFVEVTVDPNNLTTPLIVTDSIIFIANGFQTDIDLVAWGQDAYFHRPDPNSQISPFFFLSCGETWNNDKPHVIYGYAIVDSSCTLTVNAGTNVHLHPGSGIIVFGSGTLLVNGTTQDKVTFQGDRLGEDFKDVPGQWDRIWLSNLPESRYPGTKNSVIKNAIIKNGQIGLQVDTSFAPGEITLQLENTIIKNMSSFGAAFLGTSVTAYNCVFANCGAQTTNILYGGTYKFYHCTFANFWNNGQRQDPAVSLNNWYQSPSGNIKRDLDAYFGNCIIYGNNDNELALDSFPSPPPFLFKYKFDHTLIKVENTFNTSDASHYISILKAFNGNNDPHFVDIENNYYQLDSAGSAAIDMGDIFITTINPILNNDIENTFRPQRSGPDMGAYERQ